MRFLRYTDSEHNFGSRVHMIITRKPDPTKNTVDLIAVGLIDVDSAARGIVARILKGDKTTLYQSVSAGPYNNSKIASQKNMYRFIARPVGKVTHCLVIHKNAVDDHLEPGQSRVLLIPDGTDANEVFLRRFASDFNMPYVAEWKQPLWDECERLGYVYELDVWTHDEVPAWKDIKAFELSPELTEEVAMEVVSGLLASRRILLPEGVTDAPALEEALVPDEEGKVQVIDYLQTYAPHLAVSIEDLATPIHDLDRPIHPAIAKMKRVPFPAQAHLIQSVISGYNAGNKVAIISSDMGTGKTIQSLGVANVLAEESNRGFTVFLLVPGITIPKWAKEIRETIPHAKITVFENWHDMVSYRENTIRRGRKEPIEFVLMSRDTAKLGMSKVPALLYKARWVIPNKAKWDDKFDSAAMIEDVWICPDCGAIQTKDTQEAEKKAAKKNFEVEKMIERKLGFYDLAISGQQGDGPIKFRDGVTDYHCSACGHNLMRSRVPERENVPGLRHRRLHPAWFIGRYMTGYFDLLVVDELHQCAPC